MTPQPTHPTDYPARSEPDGTDSDDAASAFEVIVPKPPGYLGFAFKVRQSGQLFRIGPGRYLGQPRFYALWIHRCLAKGIVDPTEEPRLASGCLRWEELGPALATIRNDLAAWLGREEQREVRDWIMEGASGVA